MDTGRRSSVQLLDLGLQILSAMLNAMLMTFLDIVVVENATLSRLRRLRWLQTLASLLLRLNWMSRRCFIIGHGRKVLSHFISPSFQCHGGGFWRQPIADERSNFTRRGIVHFKLVIGFVFKMVFGGISFTTRVEKKGLKTKVTKCA